MGKRKKVIEQAELGQCVHRRGVYGIAAEVPQEVGVLFQHHHFDACPREADSR